MDTNFSFSHCSQQPFHGLHRYQRRPCRFQRVTNVRWSNTAGDSRNISRRPMTRCSRTHGPRSRTSLCPERSGRLDSGGALTSRQKDNLVRDIMLKPLGSIRDESMRQSVYIMQVTGPYGPVQLFKIGTSKERTRRLKSLLKTDKCTIWGLELIEVPNQNIKAIPRGRRAESMTHMVLRPSRRSHPCRVQGCKHVGADTEFFDAEISVILETISWTTDFAQIAYQPDGKLKPFFKTALDTFDNWGLPGEDITGFNRRWQGWVDEQISRYTQQPVLYPDLPVESTEWAASAPVVEAPIRDRCALHTAVKDTPTFPLRVLRTMGQGFKAMAICFLKRLQHGFPDAIFCSSVLFMTLILTFDVSFVVLLAVMYLLFLILECSMAVKLKDTPEKANI